MLTFAQRPQPGPRRIVDAMRGMDAGIQERFHGSAVDLPVWKASLIRGHRKVRDLYLEVLTTHEMPRAERAAIQDRIARIEAELDSLQPRHESHLSHQNAA